MQDDFVPVKYADERADSLVAWQITRPQQLLLHQSNT